jgi:hypothetical protein
MGLVAYKRAWLAQMTDVMLQAVPAAADAAFAHHFINIHAMQQSPVKWCNP